MKQLNLLEPLRPDGNAVIWNTLDDQRKTAAIANLMRLIVQIVIGVHAEPEHQHE